MAARRSAVYRAFCWALLLGSGLAPKADTTIDLGARRELFVDRFLIQTLSGAVLKLHEPQPAGIALKFDAPWEGAHCGYATVIQDGSLYRLYYRGLPVSGKDGSEDEVTCYAESRDGVRWTKPALGLFEIGGSRSNNVILHGCAPCSHNFSPFLDTRPGAPASERFKALAGIEASGLFLFGSADGIHWAKLREKPVLTQGAFDSQNVAFWSEAEQVYLCYFRTWSEGGYRGFRTVSRATSPDMVRWSEPDRMTFGKTPMEHLYTSQTQPYFRAPQIYLATPMRFVPGRRILTDEQARRLGVRPGYQGDCADAVFVTSRGGTTYDRSFMEAWIRPGQDLGNWASRAGLTALGIVPTGHGELSVYKQAHYAQSSARLERFALRTDGFVSLHGPYEGGEMTTKPVRFEGTRLRVNFSTSAVGSVRIELQDREGTPIPGYTLADALELGGDDLDRVVAWKQRNEFSALAGRPVRIRFVLKDADVFSFVFAKD